MKTLYLIRHAKSSWKDLNLDDYNRPLNKRGHKNASLMAKRLEKLMETRAELFLSSPAIRAKTTAEYFFDHFDHQIPITFDKKIYDASFNDLDTIVKNLDDSLNSVALFGHNPSLNMFVSYYIDHYENIPTCGIIQIRFCVKNWNEIDNSNALFIAFDYPKKTN